MILVGVRVLVVGMVLVFGLEFCFRDMVFWLDYFRRSYRIKSFRVLEFF